MWLLCFIFMYVCCFERSGDHLALHVLTHSFPTRRASDLGLLLRGGAHRRGQLTHGGRRGAPSRPPRCHQDASRWRASPSQNTTRWCSLRISSDPARPMAASRNTPANIVARLMLTDARSEEHTSELQSLMRISYAVFRLKTQTPTCRRKM